METLVACKICGKEFKGLVLHLQRLHINGVPQASSAVAYTLTDNQTTLSIGKYGSTGGHVFNMEEFRVTRAARYFGTFVAPERAMPTKG